MRGRCRRRDRGMCGEELACPGVIIQGDLISGQMPGIALEPVGEAFPISERRVLGADRPQARRLSDIVEFVCHHAHIPDMTEPFPLFRIELRLEFGKGAISLLQILFD